MTPLITKLTSLSALATLFAASICNPVLASAGRTTGQFAVSSIGSAQYSVPIWTPPGIRNVQPHLALQYDSESSYGLMGPGWTLNGLSVITRCNRTYAQDAAPAAITPTSVAITLTSTDGLCLDGSRLRPTPAGSTSTYQTEIANFAQVTASGVGTTGPSYFTVQGKDGLTYEYGNTTDSKILPHLGTVPYIWALDKVTDRSGNYMTFTYSQTDGAYVPVSIQYAAASGSTSFPYQVEFTYTTLAASNPNILTKYLAGIQNQQTKQLSTITVTSSGTTVRKYNLSYTTAAATLRATLTSIQECGGSAGTDCLAATSVGYQSGTAGVSNTTTSIASSGWNWGMADFNGDGRQDLLLAVQNGSTYELWVQFGSATGFGAPVDTGISTSESNPLITDRFDGQVINEILVPIGSASAGYTWYSYKWNGSRFVSTPTGVAVVSGAQYVCTDVNGDGLPDLVELTKASDGSGTLSVQLNTGAGQSVAFASSPVVTNTELPKDGSIIGGDNVGQATVKMLDFDGDGRGDLIYVSSVPKNIMVGELVSRGGTNPFVFVAQLNQLGNIFPVNWNDDGCTDLIVSSYLLISPCNGAVASTISFPSVVQLALDWDGDGRTDALVNTSSGWELYRSLGDGYASAVSVSLPIASTNNYSVSDIDGDGLDDIVLFNSTTGFPTAYALHSGAGQRPDLAISFQDGYGLSANPSYVTLTQGSNTYGIGSDAVYPYVNYLGPLTVVSQATMKDPSNMPSGTYQHTYNYFWAWMNLQGRGFSGFYSIVDLDSRTGLPAEQYYRRDFPYTGMSMKSQLWQPTSPSTTPITLSSNTLQMTTLDATANNQRYFPYISSTNNQNYEYLGTENGQLISTTVTNYGFDSYGNLTGLSTTITDNDPNSPTLNDTWTSNATNTFTTDTATWCLTLPTGTSVTYSSTAPGGTSLTRTIAYNNPDTTNCRNTEKVIEPNSTLYKVVEDYTYDNFGNLYTDTVTGANMAARANTITWNSTGQFPAQIKNALSQTSFTNYDPNTGQLLSFEDPNGIVVSWQYDNFARKIQENRPNGTSTTWAYNACATAGCVNTNNQMTIVQTQVNSGGATLRIDNTYLDALDRTLVESGQMLSGAYDRREVQYDNLGNTHLTGAPCTFTGCTTLWTTNTYDSLHRLTSSVRPLSGTVSTPQTTQIQYAGRTTTVTDPLLHKTVKISLPTGLLARSADDNGYYQKFTYDAFGSLLSVVDNASPANSLFSATYNYGISAFQVTTTDADLGARSNTYDALGELTQYIDANAKAKGQSVSFTYDALSRPKTRTEPDLTTSWTWGSSAALFNIGRLQSVSSSNTATYSESYTYDSKTRLSTQTISIPADNSYTYTSTYNATTGLLDTLQYPASTGAAPLKLQYSYANGILKEISDFTAGTAYWTANTTNPFGQLTQETLGNGVLVNHGYDAFTGLVSSIHAGKGGGSALQNNSYLFDVMGNLTERQDNNQGVTENVYYDNLYRLDHSLLGSTPYVAMKYDVTGNVTSWQYFQNTANTVNYTTAQSGCTYYANTQPHAARSSTQGSSAVSFCYDNNGNKVSDNAGDSYSWTSYNQPAEISGGGNSTTFYYSGAHQRYEQVATYSGAVETTYYVGSLLQKVANSAGTFYRHYIPAGTNTVLVTRSSTGPNTTDYLTHDHLGSTSVITDSSGSLLVHENFHDWGFRINATWTGGISNTDSTTLSGITREGYTGQEMLDNVNVVNLNGRIFESGVNPRMLSPDPTIPNPGNTQSFNRYSYVNNNPLSFSDPTGFAECSPGCDIGSSDADPDEIVVTAQHQPNSSPADPPVMVDLNQINTGPQLPGGKSILNGPAIDELFNIDPSKFDLSVSVIPSSDPQNVLDTEVVNGWKAIDQGFDVFDVVPVWSIFKCSVLGCSKFNWTMAVIGAIPGGSLESAAAKKVAGTSRLVIGKLPDLTKLAEGERTLILRNLGSFKANWYQNSSLLRQELSLGNPIRDASIDAAGKLIDNTGFLRAERNLLENHGWTYDAGTTQWFPPIQP